MPSIKPDGQLTLLDRPVGPVFKEIPKRTALEGDFPIETISLLAEKESWRKEIHRPATHTHKWWAQRLGSVFRAILLGCLTDSAGALGSTLGAPARAQDLVVFDPFAGSGTTIGEAAKLGARVIGRDINPVATLVQRQAVADWDWGTIELHFKHIEQKCRNEILELYRTRAGHTVLYYFWVAIARCPECMDDVELFSNYVFAKHAYVRRNPEAHAVCPNCTNIVAVDLSTDSEIDCSSCGTRSPMVGPVSRQWMECPRGHRNKVIDTLDGMPPRYRMYAKLVADYQGNKSYEGIEDFDIELYDEAGRRLRDGATALPQPTGRLEDGYNTRQAMRWGFKDWSHFYNDRQLYCLGRMAQAVRDLDLPSPEREALITLFSGTLEFNNLFCSYKGEGTGAVRHIFSHHILKPERTPLEANPWGTPLSSGSFSTFLDRRLQRAHDYKGDPHDLHLVDGSPERVFGLSAPMTGKIATSYEDFASGETRFYISPGDSATTDLPDDSVDLIVTDPPFMDNVHYSELADFFHAWLRELAPFAGYPDHGSTRDDAEVQSTEPEDFGRTMADVFSECSRVLKPTGVLAFTFHQARVEGWLELVSAVKVAGFIVTSLQPVKAEMSVSAAKSGAREPSNLDSIVVCRLSPTADTWSDPDDVANIAVARLTRLHEAGISVSRTDVESVVHGAVLSLLTSQNLSPDELLNTAAKHIEVATESLLQND